jgi:P27 family predicted phage terminase small subunit
MPGVAGRSGRKAKPTARKALAGNPGKRALNTAEPNFGAVTNVDPPEWLPAGPATDIWVHLAPLLCKQQVMQATDIQNLEFYCAAYGRFRDAQAHIAQYGIVVDGAQGGMVKNPAATIINEALRQMATFGSMLGLDPASRQRLVGPKKKGEGNPWAAVLGSP